MASFMDYYEEELRKRQAPSKTSYGVPLSSLGPGAKKDQPEEPQSALNWALDMITRPLYGVTNYLSDSIDTVKGSVEDVSRGGSVTENLGKVASAALAPTLGMISPLAGAITGPNKSFSEGLTSTDPDKKKSFSQIIEKGTDAAGSFDPNYEDREDNVPNVLKGTLGFIGDVALDPLSYIPGAVAAKALSAPIKGADKVLSKVSEGVFGKPIATAVEETAKASNASRKVGLADGDLVNENPFPSNPYTGQASGRPTPKKDGASAAPSAAPKGGVFDAATQTSRQAAGSGAIPLGPGAAPRLAIEGPPPVLSSATDLAPISRGPQSTGSIPTADVPPNVTPAPDTPLSAPDAPATPMPTGAAGSATLSARESVAGVMQSLSDDITAAASGGPTYRQWAQALPPNYKVKDPTGARAPVSLASVQNDMAKWGNPAKRTPELKARLDRNLGFLKAAYEREVLPSASVTDELSAFRARAASEEMALSDALGGDLYDFLSKINTPGEFHRSLNSIRALLAPAAEAGDVLRNMNQNLARILSERLGFPRSPKAKTPEEAEAFTEALLNNNDAYQRSLAKGLAKGLDAELKDLKSKGYLHYIEKAGLKVARTDKKKGEGLGRYVDQLNGFSQYTFLRAQKEAIELAALDSMRARGIKGNGLGSLASQQRSEVYKDAMLRVLDDQAKLLDDIGAHMSIGVGADTVMLSMSEVYRGILSSAKSLDLPKSIDQALFNYGTQAAPTAVTDALAKAVSGGGYDEVLAILTDPKKYGNKGLVQGPSGKRPNNLIDSGRGWGYTGKTESISKSQPRKILAELGLTGREIDARIVTLRAGSVSKTTGLRRRAPHSYISYGKGENSLLARALADAIMDAAPSLKIRAAQNEAAFVSRTGSEIHTLSTAELQAVEAFLKDPSGSIVKMRMFAEQNKRIAEGAVKINASQDAVKGTEELVKAALGNELVGAMTNGARAQSRSSKATSSSELTKISDDFVEVTWDDIEDAIHARPTVDDLADPITGLRKNEEWADPITAETPPTGTWRDMVYDDAAEFLDLGKPARPGKSRGGPAVDLSEDAARYVDAFGRTIIDPYGKIKHRVKTWFGQNYMAENAMPLAHAKQNSASLRTTYIKNQLNAISKEAKKLVPEYDAMPHVFQSIQKGLAPTDPAFKELDSMVRGVLDEFFDLDEAGTMGNVFFRATSRPELVNAALKQSGIDDIFDINAAQQVVKDTGASLDAALADQWREWTVKDPLQFLSQLAHARETLVVNKGTAMSFLSMAKSLGATSTEPAAGFVRITASSDSRFAAHLPRDVYFKREIAEELRHVEEVFRTSREFQGKLGEFVRTTYAPLLNAWKFSITLPRPGHHIRNMIGDMTVTWMRRGTKAFTHSWRDAVKIMSVRGNYADVNMRSAATRHGLSDLPKGDDIIFEVPGKFKISSDEAYAALAEGGALPSYHIGEDLLDTSGKLDKGLGIISLRDTPVGTIAGKASEGRDHLARFQHFMQILRQDAKGWKGSREGLLNHALTEVKKYHPDASLLTPTESKIRLAIPFYSWFGKILPAIVESALMHPGRLSAFNKASYNWAVANGLDPESLSDPFPDDQLFPSFLTDQALGPQLTGDMLPGFMGGDKQYVRMNPGIAHLDIMNTFGTDPFQEITGMLSPLLKAPLDLAYQGTIGGGKIKDVSDYVDQNLPGINYIANVTGVSPTGSLVSLMKGEGMDPQRTVASGDKTDFDRWITAANWMTGLGFQNLSRDSYQNYAEIEKRNRARE